METKELSDIVTVALQNIINQEVEKVTKENQTETVKAFLKTVEKEDFINILKECGRDDLEESCEVDKESLQKLIEDDPELVKECIPCDMREDIARDWVSDNPCEAGDIVNDNIYDGDARDLVEKLIYNHW